RQAVKPPSRQAVKPRRRAVPQCEAGRAAGCADRSTRLAAMSAFSSIALDRLNEAQRRAVCFGAADGAGRFRSGPLLVIAGAGTGKTATLAHRVAHLVTQGVDPMRILLLTFSRRAAQE